MGVGGVEKCGGWSGDWGVKVVHFICLLLVGIALVALRGPELSAGLVTDVSGLALQRALPCVAADQALGCVSQPGLVIADDADRAGLQGWQMLLAQTIKWVPEADGAKRRLAEVDFALGDWAGAAKVLPEMAFTAPDFSIGGIATAYPTRLMMPGLYDHYLVLGEQQAAKGQWPEAVLSYRWALALGTDHFSDSAMRDYFRAMAETHMAKARSGDAQALYLAGKYFAKSDGWDVADRVLMQAIQSPEWAQLSKEDQAGTWTAIGLVREHANALQEAQMAYETAISLAPKNEEPQLRLLGLLQREGQAEKAGQLATQLEQDGPTYKFSQPVGLSNGWILDGYSLDEEALTTGGSLEVWLWWRAPKGGLPTTGDWMQVGGYSIEKQTVVNLAPNAGFEWVTPANGLPLGYMKAYDTDKASVVETVTEGTGAILRLKPGGNAGIVGIKSRYFAVEPQGLYLMAAWINPKGGQVASIGRECFAAGDVDYSVAQSRMGNPPSATDVEALTARAADTDAWTYVGGVNVPLTGKQVNQCSLFLEEKSGMADFDGILLAKVTTP